MITESQKLEIQTILSNFGIKIRQKRTELDKLRMKGEDTISSFMEEREVPEIFNDPKLNARYNRLNLCEKKMDALKVSSTEVILANNVVGEFYIKELKKTITDLEDDVDKV